MKGRVTPTRSDDEYEIPDRSLNMLPEDLVDQRVSSAAETGNRSPKIVFGVMSAVAGAEIVEQLITALAPHHVVVHHDFSQQVDFRLNAENAELVPNPKRTGYGVWAFTEGVIRLLDHCVEHVDFDYFQLLSPACLPIKPLARFADYIAGNGSDAHAEFVDLATDRDAMMFYGPRAYAPYHSWRRKLLREAGGLYFGTDAKPQPLAGVQILRRSRGIHRDPAALCGYAITKLATMGLFGRYLAAPGLYPKVGAAWFGARRNACEYLVTRLTDPSVYEHYRAFNDIAEISFQTLLGNSQLRIGPLNIFVNAYDGWHPYVFGSNDIDQLAALPHYFARKFPDDPDAPVRRQVLEWVRGD